MPKLVLKWQVPKVGILEVEFSMMQIHTQKTVISKTNLEKKRELTGNFFMRQILVT